MKKPTPKTVFILVGTFLFFLFWHFPFQNLKGYLDKQLYQQAKIILNGRNLRPSLFGWPGVSLEQAELTIPVNREELTLSCQKIWLKVGIGNFWPFVPSAHITLSDLEKGGDLYIKAVDAPNFFETALDAGEVDMSQINLYSLPDIVRGKFSTRSHLNIDKLNLAQSTGHIDLKADDLVLEAQSLPGFSTPTLKFGHLIGKIAITKGIAQIEQFQLGDPQSDIQGTLQGKLTLDRDFQSSHLDLTLRLKLSESFKSKPTSNDLFSSIAAYQLRDGTYGMRWNAKIAELTTNLFKAIPVKAE